MVEWLDVFSFRATIGVSPAAYGSFDASSTAIEGSSSTNGTRTCIVSAWCKIVGSQPYSVS